MSNKDVIIVNGIMNIEDVVDKNNEPCPKDIPPKMLSIGIRKVNFSHKNLSWAEIRQDIDELYSSMK